MPGQPQSPPSPVPMSGQPYQQPGYPQQPPSYQPPAPTPAPIPSTDSDTDNSVNNKVLVIALLMIGACIYTSTDFFESPDYNSGEFNSGDFFGSFNQDWSNEECNEHGILSTSYRGSMATTMAKTMAKTGFECQEWTMQFPHSHELKPELYTGGIGYHNYCRNPDDEPNGAWCFDHKK